MSAQNIVVTGAAGFVGSTLVEQLLEEGHTVRGIDSFSEYYDTAQKETNVTAALENPRFRLERIDLSIQPLDEHLEGADIVYHLAAQPGVRRSWEAFDAYLIDNVLSTQRLLEATRHSRTLQRFVYASSSAIYGEGSKFPQTEAEAARPRSPYGVTKLACEDLCTAYAAAFDVPTVSLRYFTVYGPRQRPDMAFHRMCRAAFTGEKFMVYGDGSARRTFSFVNDVVDATCRAGNNALEPGVVMNIAGSQSASVNECLALIGELAGRQIALVEDETAKGDVSRTEGSTDRARELLGWTAMTPLRDGLHAQVRWHEECLG